MFRALKNFSFIFFFRRDASSEITSHQRAVPRKIPATKNAPSEIEEAVTWKEENIIRKERKVAGFNKAIERDEAKQARKLLAFSTPASLMDFEKSFWTGNFFLILFISVKSPKAKIKMLPHSPYGKVIFFQNERNKAKPKNSG